MSLWEVKDMFNKVKDAVLNLTEMEAKVRKATNNDPWGASSTLMQEIAQGTYNYQQFNEIMPFIYRRFREKEPHEWRQIYKSLVLLEFLAKNGAERVIDDCRGRLSLIKSMRSFNYIDDDGKDQGINVRNRAKELVKLLMDEEMIREERAKAKANSSKYRGMSSTSASFSGGDMGSSSSSRYQGFSSDSYFASRESRSNNYDDASASQAGAAAIARASKSSPSKKEQAKPKDTKPAAAATSTSTSNNTTSNGAGVDLLLDFDSEPAVATNTFNNNNNNEDEDDWGNFQSGAAADDDEFTDFQTATSANSSGGNVNNNDTFGSFDPFASIASTSNTTPLTTSNHQTSTPLLGDFAGLSISGTNAMKPTTATATTTTTSTSLMTSNQPTSQKNSGSLSLDELWSANSALVSLDSLGAAPKKTTATGPSLASLAQQKTQSPFGSTTATTTTTTTTTTGNNTSNFSSSMQNWDSLI